MEDNRLGIALTRLNLRHKTDAGFCLVTRIGLSDTKALVALLEASLGEDVYYSWNLNLGSILWLYPGSEVKNPF